MDVLSIGSYVSGLSFIGTGLLTAIGKNGKVSIFERQAGLNTWRVVFESTTATDAGRAVTASPDNSRVVAATGHEIIEIDATSQAIRSAAVIGAIRIFPGLDEIVVLTPAGLLAVKWNDLISGKDLLEYQYLKVSLLGHTSSGKTTLASSVATGVSQAGQSTFGRRVWTWKIPSTKSPRRILLHDNGGQEQVIETLLPLSVDSDVVLFCFKQTDLATLSAAVSLHERLKRNLSPRARCLLVETHVDQDMVAVTDDYLRRVVAEEKFDGWLKVAANQVERIEDFKTEFLGRLDWAVARNAIQSNALAGLGELIDEMKADGQTVVDVPRLKALFEAKTKKSIYLYHLRFLLQRLTDLGQIEYYPKLGDTVVIDDPTFNRLRSDIPILAKDYGGIVDWHRIQEKFNQEPLYVEMLDKYYVANGMAIAIDERTRLFPGFLEDRGLVVPADIQPHLRGGAASEVAFTSPDTRVATLVEALTGLQLESIAIRKREGLFGWGTNAYLYYELNQSNSALDGPRLTVRFRIAGPHAAAVIQLKLEFENMLRVLYGPPISTSEVPK